MNMLFMKYFFVGFMVSEIPRVSVSGTVRIRLLSTTCILICIVHIFSINIIHTYNIYIHKMYTS